jgi:hypothetical protein
MRLPLTSAILPVREDCATATTLNNKQIENKRNMELSLAERKDNRQTMVSLVVANVELLDSARRQS